jgi:hypothetical protein
MPQPSPSSPPPPAAPPAAPPSPGVARAFAAVLSRPAAFYASLRGQTGVGAPVVFALVMGLVSGVVSAVLAAAGLGAAPGAGSVLGPLVASPVAAVVGCFVGGAGVHLLSAFADGKGSYEDSVRVAGYAAAVMPVGAALGAAPLLGTLASLYGLYVVAQGLVTLHLAERRRAFAACAALAVLVALLGLVGHLWGSEGRDGAADVDRRFGEGSEFRREMQRAEQELRRAADEAKARQESGR